MKKDNTGTKEGGMQKGGNNGLPTSNPPTELRPNEAPPRNSLIKPCPFCGKETKVISREIGYCQIKECFDVACTNQFCYFSGGVEGRSNSAEEAIEEYNKGILNEK